MYSAAEEAFMNARTYKPVKQAKAERQDDEPKQPYANAYRPGVRSTSRRAFKTVASIGAKQMDVYRTIKSAKRPVNDQEIAKHLGWSINRVTGRRNELLDMGKIKEAFREVYPATGKKCIYWEAV